MSSPLLPHVHYLLCLVCVEGEIIVLTPCHKTGHLPSVGHFVPASDLSYHCSVVRKVQDDVEQCVEDGTENTSLWGANVCCDRG